MADIAAGSISGIVDIAARTILGQVDIGRGRSIGEKIGYLSRTLLAP
jgi:hypothetical protein